MLRTFGRIMPVLMPLSGGVTVALVIVSLNERGVAFWLYVAAAICIAVTVVTTLTVNVPINSQTANWQLTGNVSEWRQMRERWHVFQGLREDSSRSLSCSSRQRW
jgi:hypothetical protein